MYDFKVLQSILKSIFETHEDKSSKQTNNLREYFGFKIISYLEKQNALLQNCKFFRRFTSVEIVLILRAFYALFYATFYASSEL